LILEQTETIFGTPTVLPEDYLRVPESEIHEPKNDVVLLKTIMKAKQFEVGSMKDEATMEQGINVPIEQVTDIINHCRSGREISVLADEREPDLECEELMNDDSSFASADTPTTANGMESRGEKEPKSGLSKRQFRNLDEMGSLENMIQNLDSSLVDEIEAIQAILGDDAIMIGSRSTVSDFEMIDEMSLTDDIAKKDLEISKVGDEDAVELSFDELLDGFSWNDMLKEGRQLVQKANSQLSSIGKVGEQNATTKEASESNSKEVVGEAKGLSATRSSASKSKTTCVLEAQSQAGADVVPSQSGWYHSLGLKK